MHNLYLLTVALKCRVLPNLYTYKSSFYFSVKKRELLTRDGYVLVKALKFV